MGFKKALGKQSGKGSGMSLNNGLVKVQVGFKQWFGQWLSKDLGMFREGFGWIWAQIQATLGQTFEQGFGKICIRV